MSNNFEAFLNEITESTSTHFIVEDTCKKIEPLLISRTGKKRQVLPLFGFQKSSLLMGMLRTLAQTSDESSSIEQTLNLHKGTLLYLKNNFGNPRFIGSNQVIDAIPMNLNNIKKCAKFILSKQGVKDFSLVDDITQEQINSYYEFANDRVERDLAIQNELKEVQKNQSNVTDSIPFDMD